MYFEQTGIVFALPWAILFLGVLFIEKATPSGEYKINALGNCLLAGLFGFVVSFAMFTGSFFATKIGLLQGGFIVLVTALVLIARALLSRALREDLRRRWRTRRT